MANRKVVGVRVFVNNERIYGSDVPVRPGAIAMAVQNRYGLEDVAMTLKKTEDPMKPVRGDFRVDLVLTVEGGECTDVAAMIRRVEEKKRWVT